MKKNTWIVIVAVVVILGVVFGFGYMKATKKAQDVDFTIVYTNDLDSDLEPCG